MELGANKQSLTRLVVVLAVLAVVVYLQFFSGPRAAPSPSPSVNGPPATNANAPQARVPAGGDTSAGSPRTGGPQPDGGTDPAAEVTIRRDLLERVRAIEVPSVERDIFNFGRPKPREVAGPTPAEAKLAQARLDAATRKPTPKPQGPTPKPMLPKARPPDWKYFGLASAANSDATRGFLLDGEEILIASEGALLQGRYRITGIDEQAIALEDVQASQVFSIALELPK